MFAISGKITFIVMKCLYWFHLKEVLGSIAISGFMKHGINATVWEDKENGFAAAFQYSKQYLLLFIVPQCFVLKDAHTIYLQFVCKPAMFQYRQRE